MTDLTIILYFLAGCAAGGTIGFLFATLHHTGNRK